ncbi:hypothetical protein, partial [Yinghuangia sp. YIM S10712]|uniref:hypothetical protein n=1 Tax=Yinghuangia sp. YIM S10712 TaxID=3436930 RepID=UPI003F53DE4A
DLLQAAGGGNLTRFWPVAAGAAGLLLLALGLRGRRSKTVEVVVVGCCGHSRQAVETVTCTR